jgi:hypothetical protein
VCSPAPICITATTAQIRPAPGEQQATIKGDTAEPEARATGLQLQCHRPARATRVLHHRSADRQACSVAAQPYSTIARRILRVGGRACSSVRHTLQPAQFDGGLAHPTRPGHVGCHVLACHEYTSCQGQGPPPTTAFRPWVSQAHQCRNAAPGLPPVQPPSRPASKVRRPSRQKLLQCPDGHGARAGTTQPPLSRSSC